MNNQQKRCRSYYLIHKDKILTQKKKDYDKHKRKYRNGALNYYFTKLKNNKNYLEKKKIYNHERYLKNKKRINKQNRIYRLNHREKILQTQRLWKLKNLAKVVWYSFTNRAKKCGIKIYFNKSTFLKWYEKQPKECAYCGIKESQLKNNPKISNSIYRLTLDRIINKKGYRINNLVLCCSRCNLIKSNFFTYEEMLEIGRKFVKPRIS